MGNSKSEYYMYETYQYRAILETIVSTTTGCNSRLSNEESYNLQNYVNLGFSQRPLV